MRRIVFEYLDPPLRLDVLPADVNVNAVFRAAAITHAQPAALAAMVGRLSEDAARRRLARAYAEGVITGSPTEGYTHYSRDDWCAWLLAHPEEFDRVRGICEVLSNFEDPDHAQEGPQAPGA